MLPLHVTSHVIVKIMLIERRKIPSDLTMLERDKRRNVILQFRSGKPFATIFHLPLSPCLVSLPPRGNERIDDGLSCYINRNEASRNRGEEPSWDSLGAVHNEIRYCKWTWLISGETTGWTSDLSAIRTTPPGFRALFYDSTCGPHLHFSQIFSSIPSLPVIPARPTDYHEASPLLVK